MLPVLVRRCCALRPSVRWCTSVTPSWASLGLAESLTAPLIADFPAPTEIQAKSIPLLLNGDSAVLSAETGSGKTLAYLLPILHALVSEPPSPAAKPHAPEALVLVPTQELVQQLQAVFNAVAPPALADTVQVAYGKLGPAKQTSFRVLVATPVALRDNVRTKQLEQLRTVVMDEADLLLSGGFQKPVLEYLLPLNRLRPEGDDVQYVLCAATLPDSTKHGVRALLAKHWRSTSFTEIKSEGVHRPVARLRHVFVQSDDVDLDQPLGLFPSAVSASASDRANPVPVPAPVAKPDGDGDDDELSASRPPPPPPVPPLVKWRQKALVEALVAPLAEDDGSPDGPSSSSSSSPPVEATRLAGNRGDAALRVTEDEAARVPTTLVFVNSVEAAVDTYRFLRVAAPTLTMGMLHKRVGGKKRRMVLQRFMSGDCKVLVCTDVAARGIDTVQVDHVIQAELANDAVTHLHRIGRTARMGRAGRVTCLVAPSAAGLAAELVSLLTSNDSLDATFSHRRRLGKSQKRRRAELEDELLRKEIEASRAAAGHPVGSGTE